MKAVESRSLQAENVFFAVSGKPGDIINIQDGVYEVDRDDIFPKPPSEHESLDRKSSSDSIHEEAPQVTDVQYITLGKETPHCHTFNDWVKGFGQKEDRVKEVHFMKTIHKESHQAFISGVYAVYRAQNGSEVFGQKHKAGEYFDRSKKDRWEIVEFTGPRIVKVRGEFATISKRTRALRKITFILEDNDFITVGCDKKF